MKTPILDGIAKQAASKLMWGAGGAVAGVLAWPKIKSLMGVSPETLQRFEQGDPNYGQYPTSSIPSRFTRPAR